MSEPLLPLVAKRKTGEERLHRRGVSLQHSLMSFWQWSGSDLVGNTARGRFAEFLVATVLDVDISDVRAEWDAVDLVTRSRTKIEVKSAAYVQTWYQTELTRIVWGVPLTHAWDPATNQLSTEARRHADVYVLALLHHREKLSADPLDVDQWSFFVLPTRTLDARIGDQKTIGLASVKKLCAAVPYDELRAAVEQAAVEQAGTS
jgi:hypothetical protein